jgi:hypothetical protein
MIEEITCGIQGIFGASEIRPAGSHYVRYPLATLEKRCSESAGGKRGTRPYLLYLVRRTTAILPRSPPPSEKRLPLFDAFEYRGSGLACAFDSAAALCGTSIRVRYRAKMSRFCAAIQTAKPSAPNPRRATRAQPRRGCACGG